MSIAIYFICHHFYMKNQYCTKLLNYFELNMQNCENWLIWTFEKEFERLIKDVCIQVDYSNMKFDWILKMKRISARINDIKCKIILCGMIRNMDLIIQRFPNHTFQPNQFSIYVLIELALIMINLKNTLRENIKVNS